VRTDSIRELVGEGADILVQVLKDPLGTKGARLTTFITIPSRYLVYMPFGHGVGVSARIETEEERQRLREAVQAASAEGDAGGYIVRTAAEGAAAEALRADMLFLRKLWEVLTSQARGAGQGTLVHEDLALPLRLMRDLVGEGVDRVLARMRAGLVFSDAFAQAIGLDELAFAAEFERSVRWGAYRRAPHAASWCSET